MDMEIWLIMAEKKLKTLPKGTVFELKQLFDSIQWNNLPPKERRKFGQYFSSKVKDGTIKNMIQTCKNNTYINKYKKI